MPWVKEPLVHFIVLGAVLFGVYGLVNPDSGPEDNQINVSQGRIENLAAIFSKTWQRPPTEPELKGMVSAYVREEVMYREAVRMGLDYDDTIIRRRMMQKLEFLANDALSGAAPTREELEAYLAAHSSDFKVDERFSFRQIFLNVEERGDSAEADAVNLLKTLKGDSPKLAELSDTSLFEFEYPNVSAGMITRIFGKEFSKQMSELPANASWTGPIRSGYGLHLVKLDEKTPAREPSLDEVRASVLRQYENKKRLRGAEDFYSGLLKKYEVTIEGEGADSLINSAQAEE